MKWLQITESMGKIIKTFPRQEFAFRLRIFGGFKEAFQDWGKQNSLSKGSIEYGRIENPPEVLLVQLDRFSNGSRDDRLMDLSQNLELPLEMMVDFSVPRKYKLIGGIRHKGATANSGHYIAYIKTPDGFLEFNDSVVQPMIDKNALAELKAGHT
jgi:ubiquitin C-terminal hydrolase